MTHYARKRCSRRLDLHMPTTVREGIVGIHGCPPVESTYILTFKDEKMTLYNWHTQLPRFMKHVVRHYDQERKEMLITHRSTDKNIRIPGEDARVCNLDEIVGTVQETLDWLAPADRRDFAQAYFNKLAYMLQHSNRALAQNTLQLCFQAIPIPNYTLTDS